MGLFMQKDGNGRKLTVFSDRSRERSCVLLGREVFDLDPQHVETLCRVLYDNAGMQWPGNVATPDPFKELALHGHDNSVGIFNWTFGGNLSINISNVCVAARAEFNLNDVAHIRAFIGRGDLKS